MVKVIIKLSLFVLLFASTTAMHSMHRLARVAKSPAAKVALGVALGITSTAQVYKPTITYGIPKTAHEPVTVASHGFGARKEHAFGYHVDSGNQGAFIEGVLHAFDYDDVDSPLKTNLGQKADIVILDENAKKYEDCDLFGWSRGASAIGNYAGTHELKNVRAIILESPFDDLKNVVKKKTGFASSASVVGWATNHDPNGVQPVKVADKVDKNIPILIYCCKNDTVVDAGLSIEYYKVLRRSGHNKAYLLVVDRGAHANIINGKDGEIVRNVVHAFKKAHNRPHNPEWAKEGQERYKQCQPAFDEKPKKQSSWFSSLSS